MTSPSVPERILLVRLSHLGDVVHSLGLFHALHTAFPRAQIAWAVQPEFAELVRPLPGLVRVVSFGRSAGWRAWPRIRRELRDFAPDLTIDAQGNLKSAAVTWLSGAQRRVGLARQDWREPLGALAMSETAPPCEEGALHAVHRTMALISHLCGPDAPPLRLDPALSDAEREEGQRTLQARLPGADENAVILKLAPTGDVRGLPLSTWLELWELLGSSGRPVLFLAGPGERAVGLELAQRITERGGDGETAVWVDQSGVRPLAGLFAAAAARGVRYVGCDSGPLHLAASVGMRCVAICGPTDDLCTGPWPLEGAGPHRIARSSLPLSCMPCRQRSCGNQEGRACLDLLPAETIRTLLD